MTKESVPRNMIIETLVKALKSLNFIYAFWEAGAVAFNRLDEWSDIDLYLVVDDGKIDEAFLAVEKTLGSLSTIKQKYAVPQMPEAGYAQAFYRLEGASEYHIIDLAIFKLSSPNKFLEQEIHGNAVFYFEKTGKMLLPPLDRDAMVSKLKKRLERLKSRFEMFNNFIQKEINRGNLLEAIDPYYNITLASIVEVLRIKHNPFHHDFKMRYIYYELPLEIIERLEHLYFVRDGNDLQNKYLEASKWFVELISGIDLKELERHISNKSPD